jgi:hypothetical protein
VNNATQILKLIFIIDTYPWKNYNIKNYLTFYDTKQEVSINNVRGQTETIPSYLLKS